MNLFEIVKYGVSCREAAERYGVEVNHYGMALCPFHNDRHPSLYVADDHYYCFACGEHGDVIDFVGKLFLRKNGGLPDLGQAAVCVFSYAVFVSFSGTAGVVSLPLRAAFRTRCPLR